MPQNPSLPKPPQEILGVEKTLAFIVDHHLVPFMLRLILPSKVVQDSVQGIP